MVGLATVMFIIIALVSFGAMVGIALKAGESSGRLTEGEACRMMLSLQDVSKKATLDLSEVKNSCETIKLEEKFGKGDQQQMAQLIANKVARTWWIVHEGEIEDVWDRDGWLSGEKCKIMYSLNFKPKKSKGSQIELSRDQLMNFFDSTIYPPKKKENLTYSDYLLLNKKLYFDILPKKIPLQPDSDKLVSTVNNHDTYAIIVIGHDGGTFLDYIKYTPSNLPNYLVANYIVKNYPNTDVASYMAQTYGKSYSGIQIYFTTMDYAQGKLGCEYI